MVAIQHRRRVRRSAAAGSRRTTTAFVVVVCIVLLASLSGDSNGRVVVNALTFPLASLTERSPQRQQYTTTSRSSFSQRESLDGATSSPTALYMVDAENENEQPNANGAINSTGLLTQEDGDEEEEGQSTIFSPRPPEESPRQALLVQEYEALQDQSDRTAFVIEELSSRANELQRLLNEKKKELKESRGQWGFEKSSLLDRIAQLSGMVEQNQVVDEEERYRQEKLANEVELLQQQIVQTNMALKREQKASSELRERLNDVEDAMEFEQMSFEKERKELQKQLEAEKSRLQNIQSQWDADKSRFESERQVVQQQLDEERDRLKKAQIDWASNQFEYEQQQEALQQMLEEQKEKLKETEAMIESEREQFGEERSALNSVIDADRLKLAEIEQALEEERINFRAAQADLEEKILNEQDKVDALYVKLQQEQERFYLEKDNLEVSLEVERNRVQRVEAELDRERQDFQSEKARLQEEIDEQIRINRLKKKQMANRYEEIRTQLTGLWEGAKRDAREEKKKLTAKYETQLSNMGAKVTELERNLFSAQKASEELNLVLSNLQIQKDRAQEETQNVEARYITMISQRNREIADLKGGINQLKDTVRQREEQLQKYESSFRELVKLGMKVTGNKIKKGRTRVSGWFRRGDSE